jgi:hypothetical protein
LRKDFENGLAYDKLHGTRVLLSDKASMALKQGAIRRHLDNVFMR